MEIRFENLNFVARKESKEYSVEIFESTTNESR